MFTELTQLTLRWIIFQSCDSVHIRRVIIGWSDGVIPEIRDPTLMPSENLCCGCLTLAESI